MTFLQDAWYGLRLMLRRPGFTAVILLSLASAVGASGAVFSVINAFVLRELPVRDPHQLVEFLSRYPGEPRMYSFGWADYEHYRDHNRSFSEIIVTGPARFDIRTGVSSTETVVGEYAVGDFFDALGVRPAIGRLIGRADASDPAVAVLSWPYWRSRFNLDPSAVGSRIVVNGVSVTVVGVTSQDFFGLQLGRTPAVWIPLELARQAGPGSSLPPAATVMVGRLRPGVSLEQARAEMRTLDRVRIERLAVRDPAWLEAQIELEPAAAGLTGLRDQFGNQLLVLMATVTALLLVACLNIATMLAARCTARRHELAVRVALGAARWRLARQLFTEGLLLATAGTAFGLLLANAGGHALLRALPVDPRSAIRLDDVTLSIDWRILAFATGTTVLTALLFALAPAWGAIRSAAFDDLRHRSAETPARRLYEQTLVAAQLAFALVLGSAAVMLVTHVSRLRTDGAGFSADSVVLMKVDPGRAKQSPDSLLRTYQAVLQRIRTLPGVSSATLAAITPIEGGAASQFMRVQGFDEPAESRRRVSLNWVAPQYFETLRTPLVAGRDFVNEDEGGPAVAIVNQRVARHYFGEASPIGRRFTLERGTESYEIVGVAADAKYSSLHEPAPATVYLHAYQGLRGGVSQFAIRVTTRADTVAPALRGAVADTSSSLSIAKLTTLRAQVDGAMVIERLLGDLTSLLAGMAAVLVGIGLYGLLAFTVASRRREIGIRMVLGATPGNVIGMILRAATRLVIVGLIVGIPLAIWLRGVAATLIPDFHTGSAAPVFAAAALITMVALAAAWLPARSASRVHPADALRLP